MKRLWVIITLGLLAFLVLGTDLRNPGFVNVTEVTKKVCRGYTVIESSMGVDCNGDTIKLRRVSGFYERVLPDEIKETLPVFLNSYR